MAIYGQRGPKAGFSKPSNASVLGQLIKDRYQDVALTQEARAIAGKAFLTFESFTSAEAQDLNAHTATVETAVTEVKNQYETQTNDTLTADQVEALGDSIVVAQNPDEYLRAAAERPEGTVISSVGGDSDVGVVNAELTKESFEVHGMANTLSMTVSYNVRAEKQAAAVELFFPTISLDSTQNNYTIDVHLSTVFTDEEYDVSGKGDLYRHQKHVIKALRDASILKSNFTDIVPVYRAGVNDKYFVDPAISPVRVVRTDYGEDITTGLLKMGEQIPLLHISQTDRQISKGSNDSSDQIAPNPKLKTLGLKVGNDTVLFENLQHHQASQFTYSTVGDREGIQLIYDVNTHFLNKDTKGQVSGALPTELQALEDKGLEAMLSIRVMGLGNTNYGFTNLNASKVTVRAVRNAATKEELSLEDPAIKALVEALETTEVIGYEVDANLTNANIREHGALLDDNVQRIIYGVKLHSPIAVRRPMDAKDAVTDEQRIDTLIKMSFIRRTNAGVTAIYDIMNMLLNQPQDVDMTEPYHWSVIGAGQYYARTYVRDLTLDVLKTIQTMQTSDKRNNINSLFSDFILAEMTQAFCQSELAAAYELTDIGSGKPHVIAMTDHYTGKFIFREGDIRTLGDGFDFTIKEISDGRLVDGKKDGDVGTIFLTFGKPKHGDMRVPLWFGNTLDKREIPRIVSRARGSKYQHETMVQPFFSHIVHLPILIRVRVENLKEAVQKRIPFAVENTALKGDGTPVNP